MSDHLIILPGDLQGEALLASRAGGRIDVQRIALADATLPTGHAAILPGQLVRAATSALPANLRGAERINVARYAHEDSLATDPAGLHIVVGPGTEAPTRLIDPAVMDEVIARSDPARIVADFDALAGLGGPARVLDRVVVPGEAGYAVDADWAEPGYAVPTDEAVARAAFDALDAGVLDLRGGAYRRRRAVAAGPWLRVAAAAIACLALGLVVTGLEARAVAGQADALEAQARTLYQEATGTPAPARLSSLARSAPANADGAQFLALSDTLFAAVAATPGTRVERLSFDGSENVLRVRLAYPDFDTAAALEQAVAQAGAQLTTGGVREQNGSFIGDAALSGAAP